MAAPVQQPDPAVVAPVTQEGRHGVQDALDSVASSAVADTLRDMGIAPGSEGAEPVDDQTPVVEEGAREDGASWNETAKRWQRPDGSFAEGAAPAPRVAAEAAEGVETEPVVFPEGFVPVPKIEGRELATTFKVMDKDGELEIPDMTIEFNANGRTRKESLDKVVKLAQWGVFNQERHEQVETTRREAETVFQQNRQILDYVRRMEAERETLLSSDDAYLTARAKYEMENTPEAKLARREQEIASQGQQQEFTQASNLGQQFFASELAPGVEAITKALPTVSADEIGARLLLVTNRYMVHTPLGSIIHPNAYPEIRKAIVSEIVPWAQQVHDARDHDRQSRATTTDAEKQALEKAAEKARVDAQKAKNLLGKVNKPRNAGAANGTGNPATPKPIKTADDAEKAALAATMAGMGFKQAG